MDTEEIAKDPFSCKETMDNSTGVTSRTYYYNGVECEVHALASPRARQLAGYVLIEKDLRNCLSWLDEIETITGPTDQAAGYVRGEDRKKFTVVKGLFASLITFYAKCFTRCEGRRVKLERRELDPTLHDMHDYCMRLRNNFTAHSGADRFEEVRMVVAYLSPDKGGLLRVFSELQQPDVLGTTSAADVSLRQLLSVVQSSVRTKMHDLSTHLQGVEAADWYMQHFGVTRRPT